MGGQKIKRIAIVGGGPCGISIMNAFVAAERKGEEIPELVCFEKQNQIGGLWNYTWRTGVDEYGEQLHNGMYRYLWSNGPKECSEMADYTFDEHFKKQTPSFPPRLVLRDYLLGKARKYGITKYVRFQTVVRNVSEIDKGRFSITFENLEEKKTYIESFDQVVVATGHFSVPYFPSYPGLETFPDRVIHAHDFRDAAGYKGKRVVLIGSSYSAEDIALQLYKYGAKEVIISYRVQPLNFKWPEEIKEYPLLTDVQGSTVNFSNGKSYDADAIIFCTGYQYKFPFLSDSLRLKCQNILYPNHLYKGIVFNRNPNLMYLGMQDQWYTFSMFDAESYFARDYILGKIELPEKGERDIDIEDWYNRGQLATDNHASIDYQRDYINDLNSYTDYPKHDNNMMALHFRDWLRNKKENILTYREHCFKSTCTGTVGIPLYAPWLKAFDDSVERFIES